jgi:hypothetical protein
MCKLMDNYLASHAPLKVPCKSLLPETNKVIMITHPINMYALYFQVYSFNSIWLNGLEVHLLPIKIYRFKSNHNTHAVQA